MKRLILLLTLLASGLAHGQSAEKYKFPARGEDLPQNTYWWLRGPHTGHPTPKDIVGVRWDGSAWTDHTVSEASYNADPTKEKHVIYGMPVYSPSDGKIISCWRNAPESTGDPSVKHPEYLAGRVTTVGNHVNILTPEGNVILLGHFQTDTLDPALCPIEDDLFCDPNDPDPGCLEKADMYLAAADQPVVRKGQFVARVGTSGNSTGPHLHLQIADAKGNMDTDFSQGVTWEYPFSQMWAQTVDETTAEDTAGWLRVSGEALNANPKQLIYPDPLQYRSQIPLDGANRRAAASHLQFLVTAKLNPTNQLRVSSFRVDDAGQMDFVVTDNGNAASAVDIANTGIHSEFGVGVRDAAGFLKLIYYAMDGSGNLDRQDSVKGPSIGTRLAMDGTGQLGVDRGVVVVAPTANASNTLQVIAYKVVQTAGVETEEDDTDDSYGFEARGFAVGPRMGGSEYPDVTTLENARAPGEESSFRGAVTAIVDDTGNLRLDSFRMESNLSLYSAGTLSGGNARKVFIETIRLNADRQIVVVAMKLGSGELKVSTYQVDAAGAITPIDSSTEGVIADLGMFAADQRHVVTPVKNQFGTLEVITWEVQDDGTIRRIGTVASGSVDTQLTGATVITGGRRFVITSQRPLGTQGSGTQLMSWEANLR